MGVSFLTALPQVISLAQELREAELASAAALHCSELSLASERSELQMLRDAMSRQLLEKSSEICQSQVALEFARHEVQTYRLLYDHYYYDYD